MRTTVFIDPNESQNIEILFVRLNAYYAALNYMINHSADVQDKQLFDSKWEEAICLYQKLEEEKSLLEKKYKPQDGNDYKQYSFDFDLKTMVFDTTPEGENA